MTGLKQFIPSIEGLGLTASHRRNIKDGSKYDKYFKTPTRKDPFLSKGATTVQTLDFMADIISWCTPQVVELLKKELYHPNLRTFAENVWNFAYNYFQYKL